MNHGNLLFSTGQTRALILSAYIKMINLFPEIKDQIERVLRSDVLQKNADVELQQRALEYFKVSQEPLQLKYNIILLIYVILSNKIFFS